MYKKLKLVESTKLTESDGWIAFYNGKKVEITKDEANDLWGAKQVAIKKLNVPKSKTSQLAVEPAYNESENLTEKEGHKYIIAMSKSSIKDIANNESDLDAYITDIFTGDQVEDSTKEIGYSFSPTKNKAKLFDSKYEANDIANKIKNNYPEWGTVAAILADSQDLTEADDEELEDKLDDLEDTIEANDDLQDTVDSEEEQEENPVEEESELDTKLDELREILVDLDLNLYRIASKEDTNNVIYVIGKVAEESNETLMLIDKKPEDVNKEEIEEPIINNIEEPEKDIEEGSGESEEVIEEPSEEEVKSELESRFDFVVLPKSFDEINKLNPRYGEDLTPDHEAIVEYLMNCLIETNPEAAEELQNKDLETAEEIPAEPVEDLELDIGIEGEEELEDEE
jgi:hypothetical protein